MFNLNRSPGGPWARQPGERFPTEGLKMCEQEPVNPAWRWVVVGDGDDDDFSAWPDSSGDDGGFDEDERAIGRAMAAFARGDDDWWASTFDA